MIYEVTVNGRDYRVELEAQDGGAWSCRINGDQLTVNSAALASGLLSILIGGESYEIFADTAQRQIAIGPTRYTVEVRDPRSWRSRRSRAGVDVGARKIVAPMPGKVVRIIASNGTQVEQGSGVVVIEAMKMQNELKSPKKGRVTKMLATEGMAVNAGDVLAVIE